MDFKYLIKNEYLRFLYPLFKKKITKHSKFIINQMENIDLETYEFHKEWQKELLKSQVDKQSHLILGTKRGHDQQLEQSFKNYIRNYQSKFTDFSIKEYRFIEDYEQKFKDELKIDINKEHFKEFHKFKDIRFYTYDEFFIFCNTFEKLFILNEKYMIDYLFEHFTYYEEIKINDLEELDEHLISIYIKYNLYDLYQTRRAELFNMHTLSGKRDSKVNIISDLEYLNTYLNRELKPSDSVLQFEQLRKQAQSKIEQTKDGAA
jgi:hypothetical protein